MSYEELRTAFELLIEALAKVSDDVNKQAHDSIDQRNYDDAENKMRTAKSIESANKKLNTLQSDLLDQLDPEGSQDEIAAEGAARPDLYMNYKGATATAIYDRGKVILLEDSTVEEQDFDSLADVHRSLRNASRENGSLVKSDVPGLLRLTRRIIFNSPSGAAQFVGGCSLSGNRDWHLTNSRQPLGEWLRAR